MTDNTYQTHSGAWLTELNETYFTGESIAPRGLATLERRWAQFTVLNPLTFPLRVEGREFRDVIGVLEGLSLVGQIAVPESFTQRVKKFGDFLDHGVFHGSYGSRVYGRLGDLAALLERDPDTRQAVLSVYDSRSDLGPTKRDIPCTLTLQYQRRGRELEAHTSMRSNDLWLGTPYDLVQFSILQASLAQAIGALPGRYIHTVGSLHLYERDWAAAEKVGPTTMADGHEVYFPLWNCADDIGEISSRARQLLLWPAAFEPGTDFELWAKELLLA